MNFPFFKKWKDLGLTDKDLKRLQEELLADPKIGAVLQGTGGIRKMRFAFEHRGKSGSVRIIYVDFEVYEKILTLHGKLGDAAKKTVCNYLLTGVELFSVEKSLTSAD